MARRVSRRSENEIILTKWWVQGLIGLALIAVASFFLTLARDSHNPLEYLAAVLLAAWGINRALRFTDR